jgi:hypothetical protein
MSHARTKDQERLPLPATLQAQLHEFRSRVWLVKMIEAGCVAAFGIVVAFLLTFALDRGWNTPALIRAGLLSLALAGCANVFVALYRWVWRNRLPEQLARLLSRTEPRVGDQLLGVIELTHSDSEQARSLALCAAAIRQVAEDARGRDFRTAVPNPRHRLWAWLAAVPAVLAGGLFLFVPAAASNALARYLAPWKEIPRYTFAAVAPLPGRLVVAHGEPFTLAVHLNPDTAWRPQLAMAQLGQQPPIQARLRDGRYAFELPAQIDPGTLRIRVGDSVQRVRIEPTLRPELTAVVADVVLPEYLGLPRPLHKDVRGGAVSLVKGSKARFAATASRELAVAEVDGRSQSLDGATIASPQTLVDGPRTIEFRWQDRFGLAGKEPFSLAITGRDDEAPTLSCDDLPRQKVVLDSELLNFKIRAQDDYGVRRVGMEWQGVENPVIKNPARGERILAAGGNDKDSLELAGNFSAKSLGIEPQPVQVRLFAEDYFPGRPRIYSPAYTFYVLSPEQHAIWLTEQLSKWHRQAMEVRDRELQLNATNKELRALPPDELDRPETRRKIENQAAGERTNGRRLSGLVVSGEDLVRQATRNPEFGVGHLEKWAEILQILKDIAGNRMPSVADLLNQASKAPNVALNTAPNQSPQAGSQRDARPGAPAEPKADPKVPRSAPQVVDRESSQQPAKPSDKPGPPKGTSSPRLTLPVTTVFGSGGKDAPPPPPAAQKVDEAVNKQDDLLAEFDKIADELNRVLANLEGSTLVKRLKAASRLQYKVSGRVGDQLGVSFGNGPQLTALEELNKRTTGQKVSRESPPIISPRAFNIPPSVRQEADRLGSPIIAASKVFNELAEQEAKSSHDVSVIMDDMQSYFERRRMMKFKIVLDEMKEQDVVGSLRQLGDDLKGESGVSIAQCEFWSDTLDRWADDLIDPANSGACPGSKSKSSLPPSIVLEVLQILEAEVNLREETRVAEQARPALTSDDHRTQAGKLSFTQDGLRARIDKVAERIKDLPDGPKEFAPEIALLGQVSGVMGEATEILGRPETGSLAIAAETEAIELLLQSKRINPKGGGGGGSTPGGGGNGTTQDSALALLGGGVNAKEVREDHGVSQATGESGPSLPEEFRAGLDEYFNRLERGPGGQ